MLGYSDVDLCVLVKSIPLATYVQTLLMLQKEMASIPALDVDLVVVRRAELNRANPTPVNPLLYEQVLQGNCLYGSRLVPIYSQEDVWRDSLCVMGTYLRLIRTSLNNALRMKKVRAIRFFDEILYGFCKACLYYHERQLFSARGSVFPWVKARFPEEDSEILDDLLRFRKGVASDAAIDQIDVSNVFFKALLMMEHVWGTLFREDVNG